MAATELVRGAAPARAGSMGGFWVLAGISAVAVVACLVLFRGTERAPQTTTAAPGAPA